MTLTKADIVNDLVDKSILERTQAKYLVDLFFETIKLKLQENEEVKISGFGNFKTRNKNERPGRNPKTGMEATVCARKVVTFHVGEKLKAQIELLNPNRASDLTSNT